MAAVIARSLPEVSKDTIIVPVPAVLSRVRQRGFDQAELIAKALSIQLGMPYSPLLARTGKHRQVGANRQQRLEQMQAEFRASNPSKTKHAHILLVDDVLTTGATIEAAAQILRQAGAGSITAATFALSLRVR